MTANPPTAAEFLDSLSAQLKLSSEICDRQMDLMDQLRELAAMELDLLKAFGAALSQKKLMAELDLQNVEALTQSLEKLAELRAPMREIVKTIQEAGRARTEEFVRARRAGISEGELRQ